MDALRPGKWGGCTIGGYLRSVTSVCRLLSQGVLQEVLSTSVKVRTRDPLARQS